MGEDFKVTDYLTYDQLTRELERLADTFPDLMEMESAGKSYEGRDIWALTLTNRETGSPSDKPALYVDGNIHAGEVTASMLCLYAANYLLNGYGADPDLTSLLDLKTIYMIPRVNPDGAEKYLTTPYSLRSSVRHYPTGQEEYPPGLHPEDMDGNGIILQMRVRDDQRGEWKPHNQDQRLMVPRAPDEKEGPFYRLLPEGLFKDDPYLTVSLRVPLGPARSRWGLDLNRNFPAQWNAAVHGSGPYPLSEPETRTQVDLISNRPNIGMVLAFHTTGGVIFRPPSTRPDSQLDPGDLWLLETLGRRGEEITGYPCVSSYGPSWSGTLDDWAYEEQGMISYTPELWNMAQRAGLKIRRTLTERPDPEEEIENGLKLLAWNDRELGGEGFAPWMPFDHPQLGPVEIGGWDLKRVLQNPPTAFLPGECHKNTMFVQAMATSLPQIVMDKLEARKMGPGVWSLECEVSNVGFLSTSVTKRAREKKILEADRFEIQLAPGLRLGMGKRRVQVPHLEGYAAGQGSYWHLPQPARSTAGAEWLVVSEEDCEGGEVTVSFISQRGGTEVRSLVLG